MLKRFRRGISLAVLLCAPLAAMENKQKGRPSLPLPEPYEIVGVGINEIDPNDINVEVMLARVVYGSFQDGRWYRHGFGNDEFAASDFLKDAFWLSQQPLTPEQMMRLRKQSR